MGTEHEGVIPSERMNTERSPEEKIAELGLISKTGVYNLFIFVNISLIILLLSSLFAPRWIRVNSFK